MNIPQFKTQNTQSEAHPSGKVWVESESFVGEYPTPKSTLFSLVQSIKTEPQPFNNFSGLEELDQIAYDLIKLGDEIKKVFATFEYCKEELHDLNAFLFTKRELPRFLLELTAERLLPLNLVGKTIISIFSATDEDINLLNIEIDLPGSIEEKYQTISTIEEWMLDNYGNLFVDIMITHILS